MPQSQALVSAAAASSSSSKPQTAEQALMVLQEMAAKAQFIQDCFHHQYICQCITQADFSSVINFKDEQQYQKFKAVVSMTALAILTVNNSFGGGFAKVAEKIISERCDFKEEDFTVFGAVKIPRNIKKLHQQMHDYCWHFYVVDEDVRQKCKKQFKEIRFLDFSEASLQTVCRNNEAVIVEMQVNELKKLFDLHNLAKKAKDLRSSFSGLLADYDF